MVATDKRGERTKEEVAMDELKTAKDMVKEAEKEKNKALDAAERHQRIAERASMDVIDMAGRHMDAEKGRAVGEVTAAQLRFNLGAALKRVGEQEEEIKLLKNSARVLSKELAITTGAHLAVDENDPFEHGDAGFFRPAAVVSRQNAAVVG